FAAVPDRIKQYVPKEISRDDATKLYQIIQNIAKAEKIIEKIIPLDQKLRKEYLHVLSRNPKKSHNKLLKIAKSGMLQQKIKIDLTKGNARKLRKHANKNEMNPNEMAKKILSDWLKK
ncbi:MAG: transcriptional regulator, partial [Nitrosopumilaceae archaeon]|nr:transcriptional regulator [Nitrosopumilaceae archaeon]